MRLSSRAFAVLLAGLIAACAQSPHPPGDYEVAAALAAFFKNGPAQGTGPDVSLSRGDRVAVLASERGFSRVRLTDGRDGYVASASLRAIPVFPKATSKRAKPKPAASSAHPAPPFEDMLGLPAGKEETPRPQFRF